MKKDIKSPIIYLFVLLSLVGCLQLPSKLGPMPEADIVFQEAMNRSPYALGFIEADGSNYQQLDGLPNFVKLSWSLDGRLIYGLSSPVGQSPYDDRGYPAYWDVNNGDFKSCHNSLPYFSQIEDYLNSESRHEVIVSNGNEISLFDMQSCNQTQKLVDYTDRLGEVAIIGFSYLHSRQELLFGEITEPYQNRSYHLIKRNLETGEQTELTQGINPSWSPDGTKIAYIGLDGIYVMLANGNEARRLVETQFFDPWKMGSSPWDIAPQPHWSPDGEWLVYHHSGDQEYDVTKTVIYKVHVSDGEQVRIFRGGKFPIWQP